jgi:hypothetical protein
VIDETYEYIMGILLTRRVVILFFSNLYESEQLSNPFVVVLSILMTGIKFIILTTNSIIIINISITII